MLRNLLRYTIPCLAVMGLVIALNERWPLVGRLVIVLCIALMIIGSAIKLCRVEHGDFRVTSRDLWMPECWRKWMLPKK